MPLMPSEVLKKILESFLSLGFEESIITWQGGEPTLAGIDFFRSAITYQQTFAGRGKTIGNALQTNGALIDQEWAHFLAQNLFLVGLSLDGPKHIHDGARGQGTWTKAMRAAETLRQYEVPINVLTVVHKDNADKAAEIYTFLRENDFAHLQFIPAVDFHKDGTLCPHTLSPDKYGRFLCDLFDIWLQNGDMGTVAIRFFDAVVENALGYQNCSLCSISQHCPPYLVVEWNGDVYPCDFFVNSQDKLGNVLIDSWTDIMQRRGPFEQLKTDLPVDCHQCDWLRLCRGGCPKDRIGQDGRPKSHLCYGYQTFFSHVEQWLKATTDQIMRRHTQTKYRPS